jgi:hypothetical protein
MSNEKKQSEKNRQNHYTKAFYLMFQTAFIFLIPALIAVFIGKKIDARYGFEHGGTITCLGVAFFLS